MADLKPGMLIKITEIDESHHTGKANIVISGSGRISREYDVDYLNGLLGEITSVGYYAHVYIFDLQLSLTLSEKEFIVISS